MTDIAQFLRARLDDDEQAARTAKGDTSGQWQDNLGPPADIALYDKSGKLTAGQHRHIARHDPARTLREVEATRAVVRYYEWCVEYEPDETTRVVGEIVQGFAAAYADHPDYRQEWTP